MGHFSGELSLMPLADVLLWLSHRGVDGLLSIEQGTTKKEFLIQDGATTRASSNDPREYFGQFLVHHGLLTEEQLERAFVTQRDTKVLLGRILVMIGIVPEEQVIQLLRVKISESMLEIFEWTNGSFTFIENQEPDPRPEIGVSIPLLEIYREAKNRKTLWKDFDITFPNLDITLAVQNQQLPEGANPDTLDGKIIALAHHGLTMEQIISEVRATEYQVRLHLFELHQQGILAPRAPPMAGRPESSPSIPRSPTPAGTPAPMSGSQDLIADLTDATAQGQTLPHLPSRDAIPLLATQIDDESRRRMSVKQRYVLARIDGRHSIQAIIQVSPMHDTEALEIIQYFEREGIVRF